MPIIPIMVLLLKQKFKNMNTNIILKNSIIIICSLFIFSCNKTQKTDKTSGYKSIIKNTLGKKIILPSNAIMYAPFSNYVADSSAILNASINYLDPRVRGIK